MTKSKEERHAAILDEALQEFDDIQTAYRDVRMQCLEDRRFCSVPGAQWEGPLEQQFANKPRFEVNKVALGVIRIINEYRNNRITVDFVPKHGDADELAETCDGLYRADEQDSGAQEAYDNGFEEGVTGGFGAWRLRSCYEDDEDPDNTQQRVRIEPIFDADSCVFFNVDAKRQDKADATRCFVLTGMSRKGFIAKYENDPVTWPKEIRRTEFDWLTPDLVYIAEYYRVEEQKELINVYVGLDEEEMDVPFKELQDDPTKEETLLVTGFRLKRQKKLTRKRVHKYLMSGGKILEDYGLIAGSCIPIVPVYGKRWFVDGVERCMGHVRLAKDAQRLMNMLRSKLGEITARPSVEKPIFLASQMTDPAIKFLWENDNIKDYPYMLTGEATDSAGNPVAAGPIGYTKAPSVPPALAALLQVSEQDLRDLLGNQQNGDELQPNMSGKAVELVQQRLDMQTFIYVSNFAKSVKRSGEIWLSMMKDIVVEAGRKMKTIGSQGEANWVEMLRPMYDAEKGEEYVENDLSSASMDVYADVGPSSSSRRSATVRALTGMIALSADPQTSQVLQAMAMMNMEGEGIAETRDYFRKQLLRMGVVKPTDEEAKELAQEQQNQPPDPNAEFLLAEAMKSKANAGLAVAKTEQAKAETAKTIAETDTETQNQTLDAVRALNEALNSGTQPTSSSR